LRIREAFKLRDRSVGSQLAIIRRGLDAGEAIDRHSLRPLAIDPLLRHLRLPTRLTPGRFSSELDAAATSLLADEPLDEAFLRLSSLPVKLPTPVNRLFWELSAEGRVAFVNNMTRRRLPPLAQLQLFGLLIQGSGIEQHSAAQALAHAAGPEAMAQWDLFEAFLRWSHNWLIVSESKERIDSPALIAASWIHASRLYEALAEKLAVQDLQAFCERDRPELAFWGFKPELACPSDVAHPSRATRSRILVLGFANLLGEVRPSEEVEAHLEEFADCA
jgi:hypothetical protein